jgi:hypothetical protein
VGEGGRRLLGNGGCVCSHCLSVKHWRGINKYVLGRGNSVAGYARVLISRSAFGYAGNRWVAPPTAPLRPAAARKALTRLLFINT